MTSPPRTLAITAVNVAELLYGIRQLTEGKRRSDLQKAFDVFLERGLRDRVLAFDNAAADAYSQIVVDRQRAGKRLEVFDAMIAGIALSRGADVATRDIHAFKDLGIRVINPWD